MNFIPHLGWIWYVFKENEEENKEKERKLRKGEKMKKRRENFDHLMKNMAPGWSLVTHLHMLQWMD